MPLDSRLSGIVNHRYFLLIAIWLVLTLINVNKAFHIDDTFHLEAAQYLKENPAKPMSGLITWGDDPTPLYKHNQPPLFFYLIALFTGIFGTSEIPLHLFLSFFTFVALYYFQKSARLVSPQNEKILLILFGFCPALVVNQNLMTDVPVLAIITAMAWFLLQASRTGRLIHYLLAALVLGFGLLVKYSILPLLVVLFLVIFLKRDYKKLLVVLIPVAMLSAWSFWNYVEYGSVHILDRPNSDIHINKFWAFMGCTGSVSAFAVSFLTGAFRSGIIKKVVLSGLVLFIGSIIVFYFSEIPEGQYSKYLNIAFIINGFIIFGTLFMTFLNQMKVGLKKFIESDRFIILLFLTALSAFIILFAPFMSTRHILLVLPFVLLFGCDLIEKASGPMNRLSVILTVILGLLLGISDWQNAGYYRKMAASLELPEGATTWSAGLWGWKWYAVENGMKPYTMNYSDVKEGDYIVFPGDVSPQKINENINLVLVDKKWEEADLLTFFSGNDFASLYNSTQKKPPWTLSKSPVDTIFIYRIGAISEN
jgi:4-amino-4-deoxy-L-arabinose transferase-like glycosyltransferase